MAEFIQRFYDKKIRHIMGGRVYPGFIWGPTAASEYGTPYCIFVFHHNWAVGTLLHIVHNQCFSHFSKSYFRRERFGGCAQVRLLVEKGCDSKESGSGEEEESGEELIKDLLMEEFG